MEIDHNIVFLRTRGSQPDLDVLDSIKSGILHSEFRGELTEEQRALTERIDEAIADQDGQLFSLSGDEARLAAEAIKLHIDFERRNMGSIINDSTRSANEALPVIEEVAQAAQS